MYWRSIFQSLGSIPRTLVVENEFLNVTFLKKINDFSCFFLNVEETDSFCFMNQLHLQSENWIAIGSSKLPEWMV